MCTTTMKIIDEARVIVGGLHTLQTLLASHPLGEALDANGVAVLLGVSLDALHGCLDNIEQQG